MRRVVVLLLGAALAVPLTTMAQSPSQLPGLVTEEVEPGVVRIVSDDAGHDLDATHPTSRLDLDGIAIGADGTVWVTSTHHGTDNDVHERGALVWALGRPGTYTGADGVPVNAPFLVPLADGSLLVIGERVFRLAGSRFVPDDGPIARPLPQGTLWLLPPAELMGLTDDGPSVEQPTILLAVIDGPRSWVTLDRSVRTAYTRGRDCTATPTGVDCYDRYGRRLTRFLEGTGISQIAAAPDGSIWAVGAHYDLDGGGALYRIAPYLE